MSKKLTECYLNAQTIGKKKTNKKCRDEIAEFPGKT